MAKRTWSKLIKNDFDYFYLLKLEQLKIRRMVKYFKKRGRLMNQPFVIRDLTICDKLISIILEEDNSYKAYLNQVVKDNEKDETTWIKDTVYVNIRNEHRFQYKCGTPIKDNVEDKEPYKGEHGRNFRITSLKMNLRELKAMHLYNMIRGYRMFHWWD